MSTTIISGTSGMHEIVNGQVYLQSVIRTICRRSTSCLLHSSEYLERRQSSFSRILILRRNQNYRSLNLNHVKKYSYHMVMMHRNRFFAKRKKCLKKIGKAHRGRVGRWRTGRGRVVRSGFVGSLQHSGATWCWWCPSQLYFFHIFIVDLF